MRNSLFLIGLLLLTGCSQPATPQYEDKVDGTVCFERCLGFAFENDGATEVFSPCFCYVICNSTDTTASMPSECYDIVRSRFTCAGDMERNYFNGYVDGKASCSQSSHD